MKTSVTTTTSKTKALAGKIRKYATARIDRTRRFEDGDHFATASQSMRQLFYRGLPRDHDPKSQLARDPDSIRSLIRLASLAAELVEELYNLRRAQVQAIVSGEVRFAALHSRRETETIRRQAMIADLLSRLDSPFKPRGGRRPDAVYRFIDDVAFPLMESVRRANGSIATQNGRRRKVPELSLKTAEHWASVVVDWFGPLFVREANAIDVHRADKVYIQQVTDSRRKLIAKMRRMMERLNRRMGFEKQTSPEQALRLIGELVKKKTISVSEIKASKEQVRIEKFKKMTPTQSDLTRGLKESIQTRLQFMLRK